MPGQRCLGACRAATPNRATSCPPALFIAPPSRRAISTKKGRAGRPAFREVALLGLPCCSIEFCFPASLRINRDRPLPVVFGAAAWIVNEGVSLYGDLPFPDFVRRRALIAHLRRNYLPRSLQLLQFRLRRVDFSTRSATEKGQAAQESTRAGNCFHTSASLIVAATFAGRSHAVLGLACRSVRAANELSPTGSLTGRLRTPDCPIGPRA